MRFFWNQEFRNSSRIREVTTLWKQGMVPCRSHEGLHEMDVLGFSAELNSVSWKCAIRKLGPRRTNSIITSIAPCVRFPSYWLHPFITVVLGCLSPEDSRIRAVNSRNLKVKCSTKKASRNPSSRNKVISPQGEAPNFLSLEDQPRNPDSAQLLDELIFG